ncbi:MAG: O-antigen polymerase [Syntrophomonas sp.]
MSTTKLLFSLLFMFISIVVLAANVPPGVWAQVTFGLNLILITVLVIINVHDKNFDLPFTIFLIFCYSFFFIAPIMQIKSGYFPNTMAYNPTLVTKANIYIFVFMLIFSISYFLIKNSIKRPIELIDIPKHTYFIMLAVSIIVLIIFLPELLGYYVNRSDALISSVKSTRLIAEHFLFYIPLFLVGYLLYYKEKFSKHSYYLNIIVSLGLLFWFINPVVSYRNMLGPVYIALLFSFFYDKINRNIRAFVLISLVLLIGFPATYEITHGYVEIRDLIPSLFNIKIFDTYRQIHYDAYGNFCAFIEYAHKAGYCNGKQLLGTLLFFVPRSIWVTKPVGSGIIIGDYLMQYYNMWFNNISAPLIAEGYFNFGIFGIVAYSMGLACLAAWIYRLMSRGNNYCWFVGVCSSVHLIFLLRGDLMSSFAFLIGMLFAILVIPVLISKIPFREFIGEFKMSAQSIKTSID